MSSSNATFLAATTIADPATSLTIRRFLVHGSLPGRSVRADGDLERSNRMTPNLDTVYQQRFDDEAARKKDEIWREIARYLQRFVPRGACVLDIACDRGDFIRN